MGKLEKFCDIAEIVWCILGLVICGTVFYIGPDVIVSLMGSNVMTLSFIFLGVFIVIFFGLFIVGSHGKRKRMKKIIEGNGTLDDFDDVLEMEYCCKEICKKIFNQEYFLHRSEPDLQIAMRGSFAKYLKLSKELMTIKVIVGPEQFSIMGMLVTEQFGEVHFHVTED